jgi:hypothetical protein
VTGTVTYPDDTTAKLLYVKPTLTGDEPSELLTFRKANPQFPHHSTVDQLFDWTMVDGYRRLGKHVGEKVSVSFREKDTGQPEASTAGPGVCGNVKVEPAAPAEPPLNQETFHRALDRFRTALLNELDKS